MLWFDEVGSTFTVRTMPLLPVKATVGICVPVTPWTVIGKSLPAGTEAVSSASSKVRNILDWTGLVPS